MMTQSCVPDMARFCATGHRRTPLHNTHRLFLLRRGLTFPRFLATTRLADLCIFLSGDYDLGSLKWRHSSDGYSVGHGPLVCTPSIVRRKLEDSDEFIIIASDGLWDYYTPESSIVTDVRRHLRRFSTDGNEDCVANRDGACKGCADWLVDSSLARQRDVLHEGTAGDNITVMFFQLRLLPVIPRARGSRLGLSQGSQASQG